MGIRFDLIEKISRIDFKNYKTNTYKSLLHTAEEIFYFKYMSTIQQELEKRVLVIDGAMGSLIQEYKLTEKEFRGKRFADWHKDLQGNNDLLSITQPQIIKTIHKEYLKAGADIIETNTFSDTVIGMADYDLQEFVYELNFESAKIAKEVANKLTELNVDFHLPEIYRVMNKK